MWRRIILCYIVTLALISHTASWKYFNSNKENIPSDNSKTDVINFERSFNAQNRQQIGRPRKFDCKNAKYDMVRRQRKVCQRNPTLIGTVFSGFGLAWDECQRQFHHHRWNCQGHRGGNVFQLLHDRGTREAAFLLAVTSAGVAYAVTKECSAGLHMDCGCDETIYSYPKDKNHQWSGCSDNIHFGNAFTKMFIDAYERRTRKKSPVLAMSKLHNNHVGRQVIAKMMEVRCKCHGVSGSCEFKTCWRSLPSFAQVGAVLKQKFETAVQVRFYRNRLHPHPHSGIKSRSELRTKLVYLNLSPDFCHPDHEAGSVGTQGRVCNQNITAPNNCDDLCCRRGYFTEQVVQERQCNCAFKWCCSVKCEICRVPEIISQCR